MGSVCEVTKGIHDEMVQNVKSENFVRAIVTLSMSTAFTGGNLEGWITYNDESYGKKYFKSTVIHEHSGIFAGAAAYPEYLVIVPSCLGAMGRFEAAGGAVGGLFMLFSERGEKILLPEMFVPGVGTPYWSLKGEIRFE